ncbi:MAG: mechanosensitive ion channel [Lachnospiraceae bacterium]|nr:mechanosensitive ion channel [Lachnospiraceae bacterium]
MIESFLSELPERLFHLGLRIVLAVLVLLMGIQLIKLIRKVLKKALVKSRVDESAVRFIDSFSKYALYFFLIIITASWLGVDAASIIAILGSAGVAIGLAVQGSFSNFAGGVLILILKPFTVGDYIKDGLGNEGTVKTIDVFYTQLVTPDNKTIVLPNGTLANGCITNFSECKMRRIDILVSIAYDEDIKKAKKVLEQVLINDADVQENQERLVFVESLAESSVNINVRCWANNDVYWEVKWRLTENIKYALDDAKIHIPYPQLDVHVDSNS